MSANEIVIVGGLGKTGGRIATRLKERGLHVRAVSRSSRPVFDWADRSGWVAALAGASSAYVTYQPDLAVPQAPDDIAAFADAAREAGVDHVVMLSGRGEDNAVASEERLKASALGYTILRASWFMQNFNEGVFRDGILAGVLALPAASVGEPFVDLDDVADAATTVLTDRIHRGKTYELTGPALLTFADAVAAIALATDRDIAYAPMALPDFLAEMRAAGLPEDLLWLMTELFTNTLDGRNESVHRDIENLIGRPARSFRSFAKNAADAGQWRA